MLNLRASFWVTRWSIVNEKLVEIWTKRGALSWSLFILLFSIWLWNIQIKRQYVDWEEKKAFIIVLSLSLVICFPIRAKASNLLLAFLQTLETCSLKVSLLIETPNNVLEELLFILVSSILTETLPFEVSKSC